MADSTAAASDAAKSASPTKTDAGEEKKPVLNPREEELFKIAMLHCLKSGEPQIDYDKFVEHGKFNTMKTAQNTWGKIKAKVFTKKEKKEDGESEAGSATPKKPPAKVATPRKRKVKAEDEDDGAAAESTPSPKKRKVSGQEVAEEGGRKG